MSDEVWRWLRAPGSALGAWELHAAGAELEAAGQLEPAATALDRAYGLEPANATIREARRRVLDRLARVEHGLAFRYVPAGAFSMGAEGGDPDESPVHAVDLDAFWISETPITWAFYCEKLGWGAAPGGRPPAEPGVTEDERRRWLSRVREDAKVRLQYCETATTFARDWRDHAPKSFDHYGRAPDRPLDFSVKPIVAVGALDAEELAARLGWRLPTEAEWEKAARGGLVQRRYPWGDEPPDLGRCDFGRMAEWSILPPKTFPPNGYGLYAMCGTVWEWTATPYDAAAYGSPSPAPPPDAERVLRGGSWTDGAEACTVSFRMSRLTGGYRTAGAHAANVGFRLCLSR